MEPHKKNGGKLVKSASQARRKHGGMGSSVIFYGFIRMQPEKFSKYGKVLSYRVKIGQKF